jgi:hypothetical protein
VAPVEDLLDQGKAGKLFPEKQGEDLLAEESLELFSAFLAEQADLTRISLDHRG